MTVPIALSILGASGKMGRRILQLAQSDPEFQLIGGSVRKCEGTPSLIPVFDDPSAVLAHCDVAIDFTSHEATEQHLQLALNSKKALVIGTTGHNLKQKKSIEDASQNIPILYSANFSFGIALCLEAVTRFGQALKRTCTIDIFETHHIHKKDTPSGTALTLAQALGKERTIRLSHQSPSVSCKDEIVIHSIRSGETVGEHLIVFEWGQERIELKHTAHSRDAFAEGALMGAKFLAKQPPGLYSLLDLFKASS
jgi:4-hydroxy-tetrahydrodipicolinate reductase